MDNKHRQKKICLAELNELHQQMKGLDNESRTPHSPKRPALNEWLT